MSSPVTLSCPVIGLKKNTGTDFIPFLIGLSRPVSFLAWLYVIHMLLLPTDSSSVHMFNHNQLPPVYARLVAKLVGLSTCQDLIHFCGLSLRPAITLSVIILAMSLLFISILLQSERLDLYNLYHESLH